MFSIRMKEMCSEVKSKGMPLWQYRVLHPAARLGDAEIQTLCEAATRF
jgi:hypothetical protein